MEQFEEERPPSRRRFVPRRKRNFRRIPERIDLKVKGFAKPEVIAACTRKIPLARIAAGDFGHVGITVANSEVAFPKDAFVPRPTVGKYSNRNVNGREIVRKDLPMTIKTTSFDSPNWGDWSNGSHEVSWDREVYQREFEAPRNFDMSVELLATEEGAEGKTFVFKFTVNAILHRDAEDFETDLLYALNLLQENAGAADVFPADAKREDYLKTVSVVWEILPPGETNATIANILGHFRKPSDEVKARVLERYELLASLKPMAFVVGTSGFARYFGAQFADNLVVFENLEYGNAIYVMFEEWETLSKQSRLELLKGDTSKFIRIVHSKGWKKQLKSVVGARRPKKQ